MAKLSKLLPENTSEVSRTSLVSVLDILMSVRKINPSVYTEACKSVGRDESNKAIRELEDYVKFLT